MVRPSWRLTHGTPLSPRRLALTLHSLYCCLKKGYRDKKGQQTVERGGGENKTQLC